MDALSQHPTLPDKVDGIISWDPLRLQCRDCGAVHEQCSPSAGMCITLSGFKFHRCEGRDGVRRCPDCLAAAINACPNGVCKPTTPDLVRQLLRRVGLS